jgi:hypothetical protein
MGTRLVTTSRPSGGSTDGRMYGKLGSVSLNDILQLLGMTQRTATVRLDFRGQKGLICFREGVLLHALAGSAEGERALVKLMSWEGADFVVEDGLEGNPPATISKKVDAAMLDVMTRMDEGWVPEMTPFPMLDRVTTSAAVLDPKPRPAPRKAPRPRREAPRRKRTVAAIALAILCGFAAASAALVYQNADLGELPRVTSAPPRVVATEPGLGIASDVLRAAIDGRPEDDGVVVLAAYGVSLGSSNEPGAAEADVAAAGVVALVPEAAPRVPELGQLLIVAEPWAELAVDGIAQGQTPLAEIRLPAGSHEIALSNPNFVGVIRDKVEIVPGETMRRKYSFGDSGSLRILVRPWADVYVDGRFAGQTPMGALRVPPGKHTIVLRHPELGEKTEVVEVFQNRESLIEVTM